MKRITYWTFGWLAMWLSLAAVAGADVPDPQAMVRDSGEKLLAELDQRKAELEADPQKVYPFVERFVLPHFDFHEMSQAAMGRYWRQASEAQREDIVREFRELLVRTYATALLGYSDQKVHYLPMQWNPEDTRVMVPTRFESPGAPPIPIDYRLKFDGERWLIYDVVIENVSLITNYRGQFNGVVRSQGIDGLITALSNKNRGSAKP
jgi:phospholipid transport system substrate-binding protein